MKSRVNFVLSTYNIRNEQDRYSERKEFLKKTIQVEESDILCMQEVSFLGKSQVDHLIQNEKNQKTYHEFHTESQLKFHTRPGADPESKLDGNSILVKKTFFDNQYQLLEQQSLHLSGFRVVQGLKFALINDQAKYFWVFNTHLHHEVPDWQIRLHQVQHMHLWITQVTSPSDNIFICGDFNLTPAEQTYKYIEEDMGFKSTYKYVHKQEPFITFPTGIQAPNMDTDPPGCFDYIWFKGDNISPYHIHIFGEKPLETDPTIYPSDHMGLSGEFVIEF